jgi:hypothetical protein
MDMPESSPPDTLRHKSTIILPLFVGMMVTGLWGGLGFIAAACLNQYTFMKTLDVKPFLLSCQTDLRLRAAGIRRFAEREGRLPDTLALCERDTVGLREWLEMSFAAARRLKKLSAGLGTTLKKRQRLRDSRYFMVCGIRAREN